MLCGAAALLAAAIATIVFHSYRITKMHDRLATELTVQARAITPFVADRLGTGDVDGVARLLRSFADLHYVACVDLVQNDAMIVSVPDPGCGAAGRAGHKRDIAITTSAGEVLLFRTRVDDRALMTSLWVETGLVVGLMMALAVVIFIVLSLGLRARVLAPLAVLRTAMQASTPNNPVRATLLYDDEIGAIVKAYNSLVAAARLFFRKLDRSQQQLAESERRFREVAEVSGDWFFEMDSDLRLSFISDRFFEITGLTPDNVIGRTRPEIAADTNAGGEFERHLANLEARREFRRFEYQLAGGTKPVHVSISGVPVFDEQGQFQGYRGIGTDVSEIKQKERQLADANRNYGDSISYASGIQLGLLPSAETLGRHLGRTHTIWQPKDLVGGDFYWISRVGTIDYLVFFECTGHGVPGAFMTLIVTSVLEAIAVSAPAPPPAAWVLQLVHDGVCRQLGITVDNPGHDGLDCSVVRLDRGKETLEFAGASIDLFEIAPDGMVTRHRGARTTLGYRVHNAPLPLTSVKCRTGENTYLMTTDGVLTQIGEATRRVMGTKRFEEGLVTAGDNDPAQLIRMVGRVLKNWQGREERRDDVAVIAFQPSDF